MRGTHFPKPKGLGFIGLAGWRFGGGFALGRRFQEGASHEAGRDFAGGRLGHLLEHLGLDIGHGYGGELSQAEDGQALADDAGKGGESHPKRIRSSPRLRQVTGQTFFKKVFHGAAGGNQTRRLRSPFPKAKTVPLPAKVTGHAEDGITGEKGESVRSPSCSQSGSAFVWHERRGLSGRPTPPRTDCRHLIVNKAEIVLRWLRVLARRRR